MLPTRQVYTDNNIHNHFTGYCQNLFQKDIKHFVLGMSGVNSFNALPDKLQRVQIASKRGFKTVNGLLITN